MARPKKEKPQEPLEKQLWSAADKLRKNIDAAEYKHVVLGLIFLKYISDAFEALHATLTAGEGEYEGADPEDRDEYLAQNIFFMPVSARWSHLRDHAKQPDIGVLLDKAMEAIEQENSELAGVLPKVYARPNLDPANLGGLIDLVSNIAFGDTPEQSADVLGHVFEYFLGEFALAEGKKGGAVLYAAQHRRAAGGHAGALPWSGDGPLLRQRRHVRPKRAVCARASGHA